MSRRGLRGDIGVRLKSDPRAEAAVRLKLSNSKIGSFFREKRERQRKKEVERKQRTKNVNRERGRKS